MGNATGRKVWRWARGWARFLRQWRAYRDGMERDYPKRAEFMEIVGRMGGYGGTHYLVVAADLARRAQTAELELRWKQQALDKWKLAAERARERELAAPQVLPGLTPAEMERLAVLGKECGDLVRAVGNVLVGGWETVAHGAERTNRVALEKEIGHVRASVGLLLDADDARLGEIQRWQRSKRAALAKWTRHQAESEELTSSAAR